jgi:hypothetical protein
LVARHFIFHLDIHAEGKESSQERRKPIDLLRFWRFLAMILIKTTPITRNSMIMNWHLALKNPTSRGKNKRNIDEQKPRLELT